MIAASSIKTSETDITEQTADFVRKVGVVAWDVETSGLDWRTEKLASCQLYVPGGPVEIIRVRDQAPENLIEILADPKVVKVFHHAMFDLRFMVSHWKAQPVSIACTKIASKLLDRNGTEEHTLRSLVWKYLGVRMDKALQKSDWFSRDLSPAQIAYAASDVIHLPSILEWQQRELAERGLYDLAMGCFQHIPTRVRLDLLEYGDVFTY